MLVGPLRSAIERSELNVVYQPKALLRDGRVIGAEALLRWQHPEHGFVPPDEFIQIAESTGLIRPLGLFVIGTAVRQAVAWREAGRQFGVAVNLSVRNLLDPDLLPFVAKLLHETQLPPALVTFELTEGHMMADPEHAIEILAQLGQTGVHLSVDDFGTGYSSLTYLKRLPIDEVKIDRSFVMNMAADPADAAIVESTVELAHSLNLSVVAEGIEDRAAWDHLASIGCDVAQGYFLGKPMPPAELLAKFPPRTSPSQRDVPLQVPVHQDTV
jgi:EAL domain-containing protein (putative c-di-GMP-specific phosphodiesterase class I)